MELERNHQVSQGADRQLNQLQHELGHAVLSHIIDSTIVQAVGRQWHFHPTHNGFIDSDGNYLYYFQPFPGT